jgi:SAM-dependent methyltransferase
MARIYDKGQFPSDWPINLNHPSYLYRAALIERFANSKSFFDIGAGDGVILKLLKDGGWDVSGSEASEAGADFVRQKHGITMLAGDLKSLRLPTSSLDNIGLFHVLEHLEDPFETLSEIRRIIRPGGRMFIQVPNMGCIEARVARSYWLLNSVPWHLTMWDLGVLSTAVAKAGFRVIHCNTWDPFLNPVSLQETARAILGRRSQGDWRLVDRIVEQSEAGEPVPIRRAWRARAGAIFNVAFKPVSATIPRLLAAAGSGSVINLVAEPKPRP